MKESGWNPDQLTVTTWPSTSPVVVGATVSDGPSADAAEGSCRAATTTRRATSTTSLNRLRRISATFRGIAQRPSAPMPYQPGTEHDQCDVEHREQQRPVGRRLDVGHQPGRN